MLQIKNILLLLLIVLGAVRAQNINTSSSEWLLEDAFEDEHISLSEANYVLPSEVDEALTLYKNGFYRRAIEILEKERKLQLPDNRLDFIVFLLAEAYRQLKLKENARQEYEFITGNFPQSDKIPASYFRIMEFAAEEENADLTDSIYQVFRKNHLKHPLYNSVLYTYGKLLYKLNRFDDAILMMSQVAKTSSVYLQAQFVSSLCYIQTKEVQKALFLLDYVKKNSTNKEITAEATILIGDIYYSQNNLKVALESYKSISEKASRYQYAQVKAANAELDIGNFQNAKESARTFLKKYKDSENYFEMASILEQAYTKLGDEHNASKIDGLIQRQIINVRLAFEIFQEVDHLVDLSKNWQIIEYEASRTENHLLFEQSQNAKKKIKDLDTKYNLLLRIVDPSSDQKYSKSVPHLAERRYLALIKKQMSVVTDSINQMKGIQSDKSEGTKNRDSGLGVISETGENDSLTPLQKEYQKLDNEYSLVLKECLGGEYESKRTDEEMQTKFVDWAFLRYQDKKETLKKMAEEISSQKKNGSKGDSTQAGKALSGALTQLNYEKIDKTIMDERNRLIDHVEMMQEIYKKNNYNSQILFRLAELYFDRSGDEFKEQLRLYDKRIENSKDTADLVFPEYNLKKVVGIYDDIISQYPKSELSDDAYYYKAMALQKAGDDDGANVVMIKLVEKYPESEFFIEANMNIGKYYFERPKIENGTGYKIAEEAYRKVLFYRDHPQFVQALYHLGWCYYMQDKYDDAIAVFKYLVEEVKLDFDPTKMEEKQIVNPLLRGEAIDYIAISFDEEGKSDEVLKFLQLIGNDDYSALVLKRIAELRAEDLDFASAIKMYQSLLDQYPLSISAPDASIGLIKMYDSRDKADSALIEREKFFNLYCSGSKWNVEIAKRDSVLLTRIDSVAVAMGLYVADANYRNAEKFKNINDYRKAANSYRNIVDKYPTLQRAAEARWNLAVILESKIFDKPQAYNEYLKYSKLVEIDSTRRIQAALNAIAISQSLLPPDTAAVKGSLDSTGEKAVEAVDNYLTNFF
jgi:tetratricopeptide (TPR) repeat protein